MTSKVRKSVCAGTWYNNNKEELQEEINQLLDQDTPKATNTKAIIIPHAGYMYSGKTAAKAILTIPKTTKKLIILGTSHHYPLEGFSIQDVKAYQTPLGDISLAEETEKFKSSVLFNQTELAHAQEHSIEIELPLLQIHLKDFEIVPIIVGQVPPKEFASLLRNNLTKDIIIVISVDLSHFHTLKEATKLDNHTINNILTLNEEIINDEIDSPYAVAAMVELAKQLNWKPKLVSQSNSSDVTGDESSVVGYAGIAFE